MFDRVRLIGGRGLTADVIEIERRLWGAADELRANSKLKASEYGEPVLGLLFLRYADARFTEAQKRLEGSQSGCRRHAAASRDR